MLMQPSLPPAGTAHYAGLAIWDQTLVCFSLFFRFFRIQKIIKNSIFQENHVKNTKNTAYSHVIVTVTLKYRVNCVINPVENIKILCGNNQHGLFVFAAPAVLCFVQCNVIIPRSHHIVGGMSWPDTE